MNTNTLRRVPLRYNIWYQLLPLIILTLFMINGCAVKQPVKAPPKQPSSSAKAVKPATKPTTPTPVPSQPTEPSPKSYTPTTGPAASLYASAQEAMTRGNYQQAEITLERALRIEPRNAHYWHTMAQIKYEQQAYSQAVHLCSKSNSFARGNSELTRINNSLKEKAQHKLGQ